MLKNTHLIRIEREFRVQQLPCVVVRLAFVNLIRRVSDLDVHGTVGHPLVLESFSAVDTNQAE